MTLDELVLKVSKDRGHQMSSNSLSTHPY